MKTDFKFTVEIRDDSNFFHCRAKYPQYVYAMKKLDFDGLGTREQVNLVLSQLKLKLCQDILNADFELVEEST